MKKPLVIDLKAFANSLGTKVKKSERGISNFVQFKRGDLKGTLNPDGSGGYYIKTLEGGACFSNGSSLKEELDSLEKTALVYKKLLPEIREIRRALAKATPSIPQREKSNAVGKRKSRLLPDSLGQGKNKEKGGPEKGHQTGSRKAPRRILRKAR